MKKGLAMAERLTGRARKIMALANQGAVRLGRDEIGPEHLLLGLLEEGSGIAAMVMGGMKVDLKKLRLNVEEAIPCGKGRARKERLSYSQGAKKVIEFAFEEGQRLGHNYIGSEHLLLGLLREGGGIAGRALRECGLELESVRKAVKEVVGGELAKEKVEYVPDRLPSPAGVVAFHMQAMTVLLDAWSKHDWVIPTDREAFQAIELIDYLSAYFPWKGYPGLEKAKEELDGKYHQSLSRLTTALEKYTGLEYGRDLSKWKLWAKSKGYTCLD